MTQGRKIDFSEVPAPGLWVEEGACKGEPTAAFFTLGPVSPLARELCAACPVFAECRKYSLEHDVAGTWAGTTWEQRKRLRK